MPPDGGVTAGAANAMVVSASTVGAFVRVHFATSPVVLISIVSPSASVHRASAGFAYCIIE
jgi:hypothetical protein